MDPAGVGIGTLLSILERFGPFGIVIFLWWYDMRTIHSILKQYQDDVSAIKGMYENNVRLVEKYQGLASDLKEVLIMNTQGWIGAKDSIERNQYCPAVRLEKSAKGMQA